MDLILSPGVHNVGSGYDLLRFYELVEPLTELKRIELSIGVS